MRNPVDSVIKLINNEIQNPRSRDVLMRRYGLKSGRPETLEAIGRGYGITRERVRQIENDVLKIFSRPQNQKILKPYFNDLQSYLSQHGQLRREDKIFEDYTCFCFPEKDLNQKAGRQALNFNKCRGAVYLLLNLGDAFERLGENEHFHTAWVLDRTSPKKALGVLRKIVKQLDSHNKTVSLPEIVGWLKKDGQAIDPKVVNSLIDASKHIYENNFGDIGLWHWPEISPRGVKDRAYVILKKNEQPLHFTKVTEKINELLPGRRQAYLQTVHNELIKDPRFVLIGRGVYALAEWGYEPGTVSDIIAKILRQEGPLQKKEIVDKVREKRLVKDNTILINLQNKNTFGKTEDGRYQLVS